MTAPSIDVYPSPVAGQDLLAVFNWNNSVDPLPAPPNSPVDVRTVVILDQSGSMGSWVKRVNNDILPKVFDALGYDPKDKIHLILFESKTTHHVHSVAEFKTLPYTSRGGTTMYPIFPVLQKLFEEDTSANCHFRLITVSDGEVTQQEKVVQDASNLYTKSQTQYFAKKNITVASTAIRLFTSKSANPDTRALSSVLQFSTHDTPTLIDLNPYDDKFEIGDALFNHLAQQIIKSVSAHIPRAYLALPGSYPQSFDETSPKAIFKAHPWTTATSFITLGMKKALFWLDAKKVSLNALPQITLSEAFSIVPTAHTSLPQETYEDVIKSRVDYYMMQAKLLRVVGTDASVKNLQEIANYFIKLENAIYTELPTMTEDGTAASTLSLTYKDRINNLKQRLTKVNKTMGLRMKELINIDRSQQFNAAQAAAFLRQTASSKNAKNLVRRHGADLDFDDILRTEIIALAKALPDFEASLPTDFEESLPQSFVSLANTLDGLRAVCSLATTTTQGDELTFEEIELEEKETMLETLTALEILSFFNIVGIPCQGTIGDYPDPYRYNINIIQSGHFCALSDVIAHFDINHVDGDEQTTSLTIPGFKQQLHYDGTIGKSNGVIDNVIPILPPLLFQFIYKNAPSTLEYMASVGMRRVIAAIPGTLPATLSSALLKMLKIVTVEPTEVNISALMNLYQGLQAVSTTKYNTSVYHELFSAIGHAFNPRPPHVEELGQEVIQLGQEPAKSPTGNFLPTITTPLAQLLLPLLTLYRLLAHYEHDAQISPNAIMDKDLQTLFAKDFAQYIHGEVDFGKQMGIVKQHLPAVMRAIYANESFATLRSLYNGKPDKTKIIETGLHSLVGFDPEYKPQLADDYQTDIPFDRTRHEPTDISSKQFSGSKQYKDVVNRLNKYNVLFIFPQFGQLFAASKTTTTTTTTTTTELTTFAQANIPCVLSSLETINQLQKHDHINPSEVAPWDPWADLPQQPGTDDVVEYNQERKHNHQVANNKLLEVIPRALFGSDRTDFTQQHFNHVKLINILYTFQYPESSDRYPHGTDSVVSELTKNAFTIPRSNSSVLPDYNLGQTPPDQCPILAAQVAFSHALYENHYNSCVSAKTNRLLAQLGSSYIDALIKETDLTKFVTLMKEGVAFGPNFTYSFDKHGHQDPQFHGLWHRLLDDKQEVDLRLKKLRYVILGKTESGDIVWNKGRVLFHYSLHPAAHFFYDADERTQWIDICKEHAEGRKMWEYRPTDLPNRHYHHKSHPSYFALGYDTLLEFKKAVSKEEFDFYAEEHHFCCGLRAEIKKPKWFKRKEPRSADDYKNAVKSCGKKFDNKE